MLDEVLFEELVFERLVSHFEHRLIFFASLAERIYGVIPEERLVD